MKKYLSIIFVIMMAVSCIALTACGGGSSEDTASEDSTAETTEDAAAETSDSGIDLTANITRSDDSETGEGTVESDMFILTLPDGASWDYEVVSPEEIIFYNKAARDADIGGTLFTLKALPEDDQTLEIMPGAVVGQKDGKNITAIFTSDVQYDAADEAASKEYLDVYEVVQTISDDASASPLKLK
jgi:hypothetical protein